MLQIRWVSGALLRISSIQRTPQPFGSSSNHASLFPPQALCTCCCFCLECSWPQVFARLPSSLLSGRCPDVTSPERSSLSTVACPLSSQFLNCSLLFEWFVIGVRKACCGRNCLLYSSLRRASQAGGGHWSCSSANLWLLQPLARRGSRNTCEAQWFCCQQTGWFCHWGR